MQPGIKVLFLFLSAALVIGCQSVVRTDIETFRNEQAAFSIGTIRVLPADETPADSLEFRHFKDKLEHRLSVAGYTPTQAGEARYVARLGYSVSRQEKDKPQSRIYVGGHIGYHHHDHSSIRLTNNFGTEFEYVRELSLAIDQPSSPEEVRQVVQVKATSIGACAHLSIVYDEMLDAVFDNLLRPDGSVEKVSVKGKSRCP